MARLLCYLSGLCLVFIFGASRSQAAIQLVLDFDGTIVHDQGEDAAWVTPWVLVRISELRNLMQLPTDQSVTFVDPKNGETHQILHPDRLMVSYEEFKRLRPYLGVSEGKLGSVAPHDFFFLSDDPHLGLRPKGIFPGYYYADLEGETVQYYRTGKNSGSVNQLLRDQLAAEERVSNSGGRRTWAGYGFSLLQAAFSSEVRSRLTVFSTARYHSASHFRALLEHWIRNGHLGKISSSALERIVRQQTFFLSSPETLQFGRTMEQRKVGVVQSVADQLLILPPSSGALHLERPAAPWSTAPSPTHTLIVAEDDPVHVKNIKDKLVELSGSKYKYRIKFVLFHSGPAADLKELGWQSRWSVFYDGFRREAYADEVELWTSQGDLGSANCATFLREAQK